MNRGRHARVGGSTDYTTEEERGCGALLYAVLRCAVRDATRARVRVRPGGDDTTPRRCHQDQARAWLAGEEARMLARFAGYPLPVVEAAARGGVSP